MSTFVDYSTCSVPELTFGLVAASARASLSDRRIVTQAEDLGIIKMIVCELSDRYAHDPEGVRAYPLAGMLVDKLAQMSPDCLDDPERVAAVVSAFSARPSKRLNGARVNPFLPV